MLPGGGNVALALSKTSTQSPLDGGVKAWVPVVANVPIFVAAPVDGLYHQAIMEGPVSCDPLIVTVRDDGR